MSKRSTKSRPNLTECHGRVFSDLFQLFIQCQNREGDLQELSWHEHQPFTSTLSECGRLQSCPKSLPCLIGLVINVITSYDELSADAIIVDDLECAV